MTQDWMSAAGILENSYVREWKGRGKKIVGYTCSYLPDEIFQAADILPFRLRGHGAQETTVGDTYFGPFICSLPKCILQLTGEGRFSFLDGAVITPGCDSMRRLDECWRKADGDRKGTLPGFFFHFGVPHKYSDYTIRWFEEEIRRLISEVRNYFGVELTEEKIREAIRLYNRGRTLLHELDDLRLRPDTPVGGAEALAVILSSAAMPRETYNDLLSDYLGARKTQAGKYEKRIRLMLVGSANDDVDLVRTIEGDNALVVADNLCFGPRFHLDTVSEESDPIAALTSYYLHKNECPRMYGGYEARLDLLREKIKSARIDGVILQNIRFCDLHGAENGLFERDLESEGVPCLRIEREYGPLVEKGRLKIRVDAFLERIAKIRRARP